MNQQTDTTENNTTKSNDFFRLPDQREIDFVKDIGKGAVQLGLETLGTVNTVMPRVDPDGTESDYYGPIKGFNRIFSNALGYGPDQEEFSGITIPTEQFLSNPRFKEHMQDLEKYSHVNAAKKISPQLAEALQYAQATGDNKAFSEIFEKLKEEAIFDEDLAAQLISFAQGDWRMASFDESGENIIINKLPEIDEGLFGFDMTLDPYFSEKGDLVLPGEGVFGMRDGNLSQVASSVSRPLDEMLMYNMPGAEYLAENVTDKIAFQGPEMLPPEGSGLGYMVPMTIGAVRGIGIPALKAGYKVGKSGYNLGSNIYSGILSNLQ